jgi:hypothetical protein
MILFHPAKRTLEFVDRKPVRDFDGVALKNEHLREFVLPRLIERKDIIDSV